MLKNKKVLYILFPAVILIWGIVIYKIVDTFSDEPESVKTSLKFVKTQFAEVQRDTFSLMPITKDPFLGIRYTKTQNITKQKIFRNKSEIEWPEVAYLGLVSGTEKREKIYIIQINEEQYLLETGDIVGDIKLISGNSRSVKLSYKGQKEYFLINDL